jgi:hypothetical protein
MEFAVAWDLCPREVNGGYPLAFAPAIAFPVLDLPASLMPGRVGGPALVPAASSPRLTQPSTNRRQQETNACPRRCPTEPP